MDPRHESLHLHECDDVTWQENLYFNGFDDTRRDGFALHVKLIPADDQVQIRGLVVIDGAGFTVGIRTPLRDGLNYPGYSAVNLEPFRRWSLALDAVGMPIESTGGYMGLELAGGCDSLQVCVAVDLETTLQPIDWSVLTEGTGAGTGHYDHAHFWSGVLRAGDREVRAQGLGIRDHSWGPRNLAGMEHGVFVATVAPDLSTHRTGVSAIRDGREIGFGFCATSAGVEMHRRPLAQAIGGSFLDDRIPAVLVENAGESVVATTDIEILMPLLRDNYLSRNLIGTTQPGRGFSFFEVGRGIDDLTVNEILREGSARS